MSNHYYEVLIRFAAASDDDADYVVDKLGNVGDNVDEAENMDVIPLTRDGNDGWNKNLVDDSQAPIKAPPSARYGSTS